jgi:hypothetical protein
MAPNSGAAQPIRSERFSGCFRIAGNNKESAAMEALYFHCYNDWPDEWIGKDKIFEFVSKNQAEDDQLEFFGNLCGSDSEAMRKRTARGMSLRAFDREDFATSSWLSIRPAQTLEGTSSDSPTYCNSTPVGVVGFVDLLNRREISGKKICTKFLVG